MVLEMMSKILSAGIVPFYRNPSGLQFLILRSFNYWDFPKGIVESTENPFDTAKRELQEETGLQKAQFPCGEAFTETAPYANGKVARYYVAEVFTQSVTLGINPELGKPEHDEFRWVSANGAQKLFGDRLKLVLTWSLEKIENGVWS